MQFIARAVLWLQTYWPAILVVASIVTGLATAIQARLPKDLDGNVTRPRNWGAFFWRLFVDVLSWLPQAGKSGLFGPLNLPGLPSLGDKPVMAPTEEVTDPVRKIPPPLQEVTPIEKLPKGVL